MFKGVFAAFAVLASLSGFGTDYFLWKGGDADSVQDYTKYNVADSSGADSGTAASEALPDKSVVFIGQNKTYTVTDADFTFLNGLAGLSPLKASATIVFTNDVDQAYDGYIYNKDVTNAQVYKRGVGTLTLNYADMVDGKNYYGYYAIWSVEAGVLDILPNVAVTRVTRYYYRFKVSEGAEIKLPYGESTTYLKNGLGGGGTISHETVSGKSPIFQVCGSYTGAFSGKITGKLKIRAYGTMTLTGRESDFDGTFEFYGGEVYAVDAGASGSTPNSLGGIGSTLTISSSGMDFTNIADGSMDPNELARTCRNWATEGTTVKLSGGDYGNFTFSGSIRTYADTSDSCAHALVLTGDHTNACTFAPGYVSTAKPENLSSYTFVKRGKGTWHVNPGVSSRLEAICGALIEDGTVQFNYFRETTAKYPYCSFGYMNDPDYVFTGYAYIGKVSARTAPEVDYKFRLGKADDLTQNGIMEYVGAEDVSCTTRKFAITGNGGFKNDTEYVFAVSGIRSVQLPEGGEAPALNVLTLDTSGTKVSRVNDITEEAGAIRLLKKGTGEWRVGGTVDFTGGAEVAAGTLVIENTGDAAVLTNGIASLKVAAGATFGVDGGEPIETRGLAIDGTGAGTFDNIAFAETGTLAFENVELGAKRIEIPVGFGSIPTRANLASWTMTVNGEAVPSNYTVTLTDSGFSLDKKGLAILVR